MKFYEFFAGGGMARAGLGGKWKCVFANDIDPKKGASYIRNWGAEVFTLGDIGNLTTKDLVEPAELAWASFPCQDLSLAGSYAGLKGERSGTFWPFWKLMRGRAEKGSPVPLIVLENVCGALTSHGGKDFAAISAAIAAAGYRLGALVVDAIHFVPQSRPRLFIIAAHKALPLPAKLTHSAPSGQWHTPGIVTAYEGLQPSDWTQWVWWSLPEPSKRTAMLADLIEEDPQGVDWHTQAETQRLLSMMSPINAEKVKAAKQKGYRIVGTIYKRTRADGSGGRAQRAEVRFDNIAGCLRTPIGGSSRQTIMIVDGNRVRSRLLSPRETARLMGLPDDYKLPSNYNEAYHLTGDGIVVPVVRHLAKYILEPVLLAAKPAQKKAA